MIHRTLLLFVLLFVSINHFYAQSAVLTAGGDATGTGGSVSMSVGQPLYAYVEGEAGSITFGVQQSYVIITVGTDDDHISLSAAVYPNPSSNTVNINLGDNQVIQHNELTYTVFDLEGKFIMKDKIPATLTSVPVAHLTDGIYLLRISRGNNELKTFRIIKTK